MKRWRKSGSGLCIDQILVEEKLTIVRDTFDLPHCRPRPPVDVSSQSPSIRFSAQRDRCVDSKVIGNAIRAEKSVVRRGGESRCRTRESGEARPADIFRPHPQPLHRAARGNRRPAPQVTARADRADPPDFPAFHSAPAAGLRRMPAPARSPAQPSCPAHHRSTPRPPPRAR